MKKIKFTALVSVLSIILIFAGCSSNEKITENTDGVHNIRDDTEIVTDVEENIVSTREIQDVDKSELGITMTLTDEYSDCLVKELNQSELDEFSTDSIGGFSVTKTIEGNEYTLSSVAVVPNSSIETPELQSQYPYIFSGVDYSIVATLPANKADGEVGNEIDTLQSGMVQQLCSIFFDEDGLKEKISE